MIEYLAPGFLYTLTKDLWGQIVPRRRNLSASQIVELRKKWKGEFEPRIWQDHQKKLRKDVIIRDMRRVDKYPDIDDKSKGISPWFRVYLVGTYHRGIFVAMSVGRLTQHSDGSRWRYTIYESGETGDINALLIGSIPYEYIDNVDWDGDEYYHYPHIYCFFSNKLEQYEQL